MNNFSRFPQTLQSIADGCERGLQHGVQIYVSRNGEPLLDAAYGDALPGQPMTPETINLWLSAGKPLTAALMGISRERGDWDWQTPASRVLNEWIGTDREELTIEQLLTHTAGIVEVDSGWPESDWDESVSRALKAQRVENWKTDSQAAYSVGILWFLLGEMLSRVWRASFERVLRNELLEPLGMTNSWCGMTSDEYASIASRIGGTFTRGKDGLENLDWHLPERCLPASPGGNSRGPIRELGRFYETLLGVNRHPHEDLLTPNTIGELTSRRRHDRMDETFRHKIDWGLGFIVNSRRFGEETVPYGFGPFASEETFGHGGSQSAIGFADPENKVVVAWVANGRVGEPKHHKRNREMNAAIYRDLGIVD